MNELLVTLNTHEALAGILPHGKNLVMIEKILSLEASRAKCKVQIPLLRSFSPDDVGNVSSLVAIEIIAQVASIGKAIEWKKTEPEKTQPKTGMVIKLRNFNFISPTIDTTQSIFCEASWTNTNFSVFDIKGKLFYENNPENMIAEGSLLLVT